MYTIKHVDEDGTESTLAVLSVKRKNGQVFAPAPDGVTTYVYATGRLWVMNDLGKTVNHYDFTREITPQGTATKEQQS